MLAHGLSNVEVIEASLTKEILALQAVHDRIRFLALRTLVCGTCAASASKLVHAALIRWRFATGLQRSHKATGADRPQVLERSEPTRHAHGVVPPWRQQGRVVLGVELAVADNTMQRTREVARSRSILVRHGKRIL